MESPFPHLGTAAVRGAIRLARSTPESVVNRLKTTRRMTLRDVEGICHIATTYKVLGRNGGLNSLGRKLLNVSGKFKECTVEDFYIIIIFWLPESIRGARRIFENYFREFCG